MRVIAGKYKSRIIRMPKGAKIRPTKDRIREALFAIIEESILGKTVLDAFAGSGAFGIEALSHGAHRVIFVDNNKRCVATIKKNLQDLAVEKEKVLVIGMDAFRAFDFLGRKGEKFDIILLDPPYYKDVAKKSLIKLDTRVILSSPCMVIVEHHKSDVLPEKLNYLTLCRKRRYGDILLSFYKAQEG